MYAGLAAGIPGTVLIGVPGVPPSYLPLPAATSEQRREISPGKCCSRLIWAELRQPSTQTFSLMGMHRCALSQGYLNPQRLKHTEVDNGSIIVGFYGE